MGGASGACGTTGDGAKCEPGEGSRSDPDTVRSGANGDVIWNAGGCGMPQSHRSESGAGSGNVRGGGPRADGCGSAERRAVSNRARVSESQRACAAAEFAGVGE